MKRLLVAAAILLVVAGVAFANPFVGNWVSTNGEARALITESHIVLMVGGQVYNADYTYDEHVIIWSTGSEYLYYFDNDGDMWLLRLVRSAIDAREYRSAVFGVVFTRVKDGEGA